MARQYIGFTQSGMMVLRNVRRDLTGEPMILLDEDAVQTVVLDFAAMLESGETISSTSSTSKNVTKSVSTSSPTVTVTLSDATSTTDGSVTLVVTFSSGNVWRGILRVRRTDRFTDEALADDYV